ncbi:tetratricopeptide repeat protein [Rhodospirillaceae bacterium SYSU D60014]|uniref:tetratricopeptide repeat protein n=1 Tax=Virgifigura deserti TaxID=2268457 RepID=UPI0013C46D20
MPRRWLLAVLRWIGLAPSALSLAEGKAAYRRGEYSAALGALLPAAEAGDRDAQYCVATLYRDGKGTPQDEDRAIHWYRKAAERGHAEAQFELGRAYDEGTVVPQDDVEAARWYEQAARHGHAKAQYLLGLMHKHI